MTHDPCQDTKSEVERLRTALEEILKGSSVNGRWVDQVSYESIEHNEDVVPDGYYDDSQTEGNEDDDPAGDLPPMPDDVEPHDHDRLLFKGGQWLRPALWEEYDKEDQSAWIETVAGICKTALNKDAA